MTIIYGGVDIGGTKCAVTLGRVNGDNINIIDKRQFATPATPDATLTQLADALHDLIKTHDATLTAIGISCGGPLNSKTGTVLSPPNLPGWVDIPVVDYFQERWNVPTGLQNDANAGALAEWLWGAGRGLDNLIFLTFGTGMGAGLILDGRLYSGTSDMGGEVGHMRLSDTGPIGFGKAGSFEGWCSGGGIGRLATERARQALADGQPPLFCPTSAELDTISAATVAEAARQGDALAIEIYATIARRLGQGLSLLVDILNPQRIILGSIYLRQQALIEPEMTAVIERETIPYAWDVCDVVPVGLGESIGDYAALAIAHYINR